MSIVITLLLKLLPLYAMVFLGWIAGRFLTVKKESIAPLLIYLVAPMVIFHGVVTMHMNIKMLSLPGVFFILACFLCFLFYRIGGLLWRGSEKNILAFTAGTGNTGYFGLPIALTLFGNDVLSIAVLSTLGFILYENSVGFFITAQGQHTVKEALDKVAKLPALYAFFLGLIVNFFHVSLSPIILDTVTNFRGAYIVLGMMLVGLGLSQVTRASFDYRFTSVAFLAKFFAWPLIVATVIFFDLTFLHWYDSSTYKIMLLMAIVPLASNTVAYATALKVHPEKAAVTVLLSTCFALLYIPLFVMIFFRFIP